MWWSACAGQLCVEKEEEVKEEPWVFYRCYLKERAHYGLAAVNCNHWQKIKTINKQIGFLEARSVQVSRLGWSLSVRQAGFSSEIRLWSMTPSLIYSCPFACLCVCVCVEKRESERFEGTGGQVDNIQLHWPYWEYWVFKSGSGHFHIWPYIRYVYIGGAREGLGDALWNKHSSDLSCREWIFPVNSAGVTSGTCTFLYNPWQTRVLTEA